MAVVRYIQNSESKTLSLSREGLDLLREFFNTHSSAAELKKKCCRAGLCPLVLQTSFSNFDFK